MFHTLTPTLSILTAIFLFVFFTNPIYADIKAILQETADYEEATESYRNFNAQIEEAIARKEAVSVFDRERLDMFVPDNIESSQLLVDIERMAKQEGMLFGNVLVQEESDIQPATRDSVSETKEVASKKSTELRSADLTFDVIGTYEQFKKLLQSLESSLTLLEIVEISMTATESPFQQYSLVVRTYALPEVSN